MSRSRKFAVGLIIVALLGAAATAELMRAERGVEVRVETIQKREVISTITATGQVQARRQVNISSDVMGRVTRLTVEEGDEVEVGEVLLEVDPSQIRAAVARARATLSQAEAQVAQQRANIEQAERELNRLQGLAERDPTLVSGQAFDDARTRVEVQSAILQSAMHGAEQAEAGLAEAEDQLSRTTIRAPISGRVIRLNIEEGETAVVGTMNNPGSLLLTIADLSIVEAILAVDETDVPRIAVGDSAVVELDAFRDKVYAARVSSIGNSAIQAATGGQTASSVDYEVILTLLNPPADLRPDLSATADIIVERRTGAPAVPIISVTTRARDDVDEREPLPGDDREEDQASGPIARSLSQGPVEGVFVVQDGTVRWTPIQLGITGQEHFEVLSGIAVGDTVVSGPYQTIRELEEGDEVRLAPGERSEE